MQYQNDKFQLDIETVLDQFIELAESTYEVIEDINPNEWRLEKEQRVYEIIAKIFKKITLTPCWVWAFYKERDTFLLKAPIEENEKDTQLDFNLDDINLSGLDQTSYILRGNTIREGTFISKIIQSQNYSNFLILPLRSTKQAELVGIAVCALKEQVNDNSFIPILEKLAIQAGLAVDHARLIERLSTLENISASISKEANTLGVLRLILDKALDLPRFSTGQLYLADFAQETLYLVEWRGNDKPVESICFGKGGLGKVAKNKKPIYIPDLSIVDPNEHMLLTQTGSMYSVPILASGDLLGVLNLVSTRVDAFTRLDQYIINSFAKLAAVAIWGFLRMMEVAYIDLQIASEDHVWGTNIVKIDIASETLYYRLRNNIIDDDTIRLVEELKLCSQQGYKRITEVYNVFDRGRTLGSPLFGTSWRIEPVPLDSVLQNLILEMQPNFNKSSIKVNFTSNADLVDVNGVRPMLQIAFREVLNNSIKAIEKLEEKNTDRLINVTVTSDTKKDLVVEIHDTGVGISDEDREKIFNLNYSQIGKGGGIGLKIAKMVLEQHNGSIELKPISSAGETSTRGCTFVICLPCRKGCRP